MRASLRKRFHSRLAESAKPWSSDELRASAIVIAPHQDDETLGCGATIATKTAAGASVKIVFMTDGATSHAKLMRRALQCHRTQTSRWNDDPNWMTLGDAGDGDFLSCLDHHFEVFLHKTICRMEDWADSAAGSGRACDLFSAPSTSDNGVEL